MDIPKNVMTKVVVIQLGPYSKEASFKIKDLSGQVVCQRDAGNTFTLNEVLETFCIGESCPTDLHYDVNYDILLQDTYGDGWNGNSIKLVQNGTVLYRFGSDFTAGM